MIDFSTPGQPREAPRSSRLTNVLVGVLALPLTCSLIFLVVFMGYIILDCFFHRGRIYIEPFTMVPADKQDKQIGENFAELIKADFSRQIKISSQSVSECKAYDIVLSGRSNINVLGTNISLGDLAFLVRQNWMAKHLINEVGGGFTIRNNTPWLSVDVNGNIEHFGNYPVGLNLSQLSMDAAKSICSNESVLVQGWSSWVRKLIPDR